MNLISKRVSRRYQALPLDIGRRLTGAQQRWPVAPAAADAEFIFFPDVSLESSNHLPAPGENVMRLNRFWTTVLPPALVAFSLVSMCACSRSDAQQAAAEPDCKAAVSFVSSAEACPVGSLKFHVAVTGCANSSGTFGFTYMKGNANQRINSKGSGAWARNVSEWDQTEKVALNCDQELHTVEVDDPASCTCASP